MSADAESGFGKVVLLGVGLLGGSLGLALKQKGLASEIRGVGRRQSSLDAALRLNVVDTAYLDLETPVRDADLVVVCTPAAQVTQHLDAIRALCPASAVVTDVASTKSLICRHADNSWPHPRRFVGSHPMAGSEKFGVEHANARLYDGCVTIIEDSANASVTARAVVEKLWQSVGARTISMAPDLHDAVVARTSHVPHILASCMAILAAKNDHIRPLVGKGFRDATRIAASRPEIWRDICLTNPEAILAALHDAEAVLQAFKDALAAGNEPAVEAFFEAGCAARRKALDE